MELLEVFEPVVSRKEHVVISSDGQPALWTGSHLAGGGRREKAGDGRYVRGEATLPTDVRVAGGAGSQLVRGQAEG